MLIPTRFTMVVLKNQNWLAEKVAEGTRNRSPAQHWAELCQEPPGNNWHGMHSSVPLLHRSLFPLHHRDQQLSQTIFFSPLYLCSSPAYHGHISLVIFVYSQIRDSSFNTQTLLLLKLITKLALGPNLPCICSYQ